LQRFALRRHAAEATRQEGALVADVAARTAAAAAPA
jgi:hypothetical protein